MGGVKSMAAPEGTGWTAILGSLERLVDATHRRTLIAADRSAANLPCWSVRETTEADCGVRRVHDGHRPSRSTGIKRGAPFAPGLDAPRFAATSPCPDFAACRKPGPLQAPDTD